MAAISVNEVCKQFGGQIVLDRVSCDLHPGETVGLVGANGAGKTTLFRLITGELEPDQGTITCSRGVKIGHLQQEPEIHAGRTLHDEVGSVFADLLALEEKVHRLSEQIAAAHDDPDLPLKMAEYERANSRFIAEGGYEFEQNLNEILGGLGFAPAEYQKPVSVLSGGQKSRVALAKLLLQDREWLLLDEPTNHLDIDAVRWLEGFLARHRGGAVVISHDRYLLDRVADRIIEVDRRSVRSYSGNYSTYVETREQQRLTQERQLVKDDAFIKKERAFIARHLAGQRTKEAQGRRTRLERRLRAGEFVTEGPSGTKQARIRFDRGGETRAHGPTAMRGDDLAMRFGPHTLFEDLSFQVPLGSRMGITGPNGTGKTTLLRIILGEQAPVAGTVEIDSSLTIGYYAQDRGGLDSAQTLIGEIRASQPALSDEQVRNYLARFLFTGEDAFKKLGQLSGGEQSRVRLAKLILEAPDVLLLDEPTNHLDIPSREVFEEALAEFEGTVVAVSHDRYFLDRTVDTLLVIRPQGHALYKGNYSFYAAQVEQAQQTREQETRAAEKLARKTSRKTKSQPTSSKPSNDGGRPMQTRRSTSAYDHMSIEQIERMLIEHETRLATLHERFGESSVMKDPEALQDLQDEVDEVSAHVAELNDAWEQRADQH
jgi:ATP-binding cassette subfamily F protein 3